MRDLKWLSVPLAGSLYQFEFPPTPTALPPGVAQVDFQDIYSLWQGAPYAIQMWNSELMGFADLIQLVLLLVGVIAGMYVIYRSLNVFIQKDSEE